MTGRDLKRPRVAAAAHAHAHALVPFSLAADVLVALNDVQASANARAIRNGAALELRLVNMTDHSTPSLSSSSLSIATSSVSSAATPSSTQYQAQLELRLLESQQQSQRDQLVLHHAQDTIALQEKK